MRIARRRLRGLVRRVGALAIAVALVAPAVAHAGSSADELVRIARAHEAAHDDAIAVRRYMEALAIDPTCAEAYLGLGALRARTGDLHEAERVYSMALERVPTLRAARLARANVRRALGAVDAATADLLAGSDDEVGALRTLARWHGEDGQVPAQLATWRRIGAHAEATADAALLREARTMIRALVLLVGPADPAASPADDRGPRHAISVVAKRGG